MIEWIRGTKDFNKCPVCGGKGLATEALTYMKEKGWVGLDAHFMLYVGKGSPIDPRFIQGVPDGAAIPFIQADLDACQECGLIFTTRQIKDTIPKMPTGGKLNIRRN